LSAALYRARTREKQATRSEILSTFNEQADEGKNKDKPVTIVKTETATETKKPEPKTLEDTGAFITIDELKQKAVQNRGQTAKTAPITKSEDIWQELESLVEDKLPKTTQKQAPSTAKTETASKPKPVPKVEIVDMKEEPAQKQMTNETIFEELAKMADSSKTQVRDTFSGKVSKQDAKKIFATVQKREDIDMDVFEAILTSLLGKGKLTKQTIDEILFEFKDRKLLTNAEVGKLRSRLKLE
jgi:hypothetical protein